MKLQKVFALLLALSIVVCLLSMTADTAKDLTTVTYGTAITPANWTEMTANGLEIAPTATHTVVRVVEVDSDSKPIAAGDAVLNIG